MRIKITWSDLYKIWNWLYLICKTSSDCLNRSFTDNGAELEDNPNLRDFQNQSEDRHSHKDIETREQEKETESGRYFLVWSKSL